MAVRAVRATDRIELAIHRQPLARHEATMVALVGPGDLLVAAAGTRRFDQPIGRVAERQRRRSVAEGGGDSAVARIVRVRSLRARRHAGAVARRRVRQRLARSRPHHVTRKIVLGDRRSRFR